MTQNDTEQDETEGYEVVIHAGEGIEHDYAKLLRKRLIDDGFHDHVVSVRPVDADSDCRSGCPRCRSNQVRVDDTGKVEACFACDTLFSKSGEQFGEVDR